MTTLSYPLWTHLRFLWGILFPWRFNVLLAVSTAGLVAVAARELPRLSLGARATALGIWVLVLGMSALAWEVPRHFVDLSEKPRPPPERERNLLPGYARISNIPPEEEYRPAGLSGTLVSIAGGEGRASANIDDPRHVRIEAECAGPCLVRLGQVGYPTWKARTATGVEIPITSEPETGLMNLQLPGGSTSVDVSMDEGGDERWGARISAVCVVLATALFFWRGRRTVGRTGPAPAGAA
jgi:hypothetical protein